MALSMKQAVESAILQVQELFGDIRNVALEEVELDERNNQWLVTVGFSRPWDQPRNVLADAMGQTRQNREYKLVKIDNETGDLISIKLRERTGT